MATTLAHFVDTVPLPLTDALVGLSPLLAVAARGARLLTWSDDWYASWLALAAWWLLCLAAPALFRYALPTALALATVWTARRQQALVVTEAVLQRAIADLATLRSAPLPIPSSPISLPPIAIFRAAAILTVPWLLFSYLVSTRLLLALVGTLVFTHRAPWARVLRSILWQSAFVRTLFYHIYSFLTGQPLPKYATSNQPAPSTPAPVASLRFLFTVYENQRWWVGLDWTAALLPAERPSWCSPSLHPVSPPSVFTLPDPTTVYLPTPDGNSRVKRTAIWKWDESEWRLLVRKEGSSLSRVERAPPSLDDPPPTSSGPTSSGTRLFRAATNKFKDSPPSPPPRSSPSVDSDPVPQGDTDHGDSPGEPYTDPDGWIYGDNKWENQSHRGGLGKYTRYRRWTRVAIVSELVEVVGPGMLGMQTPGELMAGKPENSAPTNAETLESKVHAQETSMSPTTVLLTNETESPLRQRLRAALSKTSLPSSSA